MLRLTLRTLLAYLDDTLEPAQAKDIGKKVAESEVAVETVERIKTVTRRRRLSAPPVLADDHSTDPNTIAEYLDNVLPPDQVTELEEAALSNDVRLAEVAACHQILTLVLGEPAKVPPTASRRMYRLVKGPESLPYRQPTAAVAPVAGVAAPAEVDEFRDHEDDLLGTFLGPRRILWLVALLVAVALLAVSIYLAIPPTPRTPTQSYVVVLNRTETQPSPNVPAKIPEVVPEKKPTPVETPKPTVEPEPGPEPRLVGEGPVPVRAADSERRAIGIVDVTATPQPLLFQRRDTQRWERVDPAEPKISTTDTLVALPGFRPEIRLDSGVRLHLWGNVSEFIPLPLSETRLSLYVPPNGIDADIALQAGRVFITAPKMARAAVVRIRFRDETWDVTIGVGNSEVAIDVYSEPAKGSVFGRDLPESPRMVAYLGVVEGTASIRIGFQDSGELMRGAKWKWDSKGGRPSPAPKDDKDEAGVPNRWTKLEPATPAGKEASAAISEMARRISTSLGPFDVEFDATLKDPTEAIGRRVLSTWMLASVSTSKLNYLIDALESDAVAVRDAAARALQQWVAQDASREAAYGQELTMKATFTESQRELLATLVRGVERPVDLRLADTLFELLGHERLAVRELARMQLAKLDPAGLKESNYDAASERRAMQAGVWVKGWKKRDGKMK